MQNKEIWLEVDTSSGNTEADGNRYDLTRVASFDVLANELRRAAESRCLVLVDGHVGEDEERQAIVINLDRVAMIRLVERDAED